MREMIFATGLSNKNFTSVILVGKPEIKKPLGRPRRRWENNIRKDAREME
jgi:hypothetical protein